MKKLTGIFAFVAGAAVGAATSWYVAKNKYERLAQEEIDSVKEAFCGIVSNEETEECPEEPEDSEDPQDSQEEICVYEGLIDGLGYTDYNGNEEEDDLKIRATKKPYVIPPDEFAELEDYGVCSLTYYADKVLADELDEMVEDIEDTIGFESLAHFGEYEEDSVFVRNDRIKCDFEILLDNRLYTDVLKSKPYKEGFYDGWPIA